MDRYVMEEGREGGRERAQGYTIQNGWKRIPERGHFVARRETQSTQAASKCVVEDGQQRGLSKEVLMNFYVREREQVYKL